ncbi:hypothetical protein G9A89_014727 [Geosiphon pyriformis]|nr:hypothetical protein G9A89_014727 [Geosiphon pyriformis]
MGLRKEKKLYGKRTQNPSGPIKKEFKTEKIRVFNKTVILFMRRMAEIANLAYCRTSNRIGSVVGDNEVIADFGVNKENSVKFVAYFRGPNLSKEQWRQRSVYTSEIQVDPFWKEKSMVDAIWLKHTKMMMPFLIEKYEKLQNKPDKVSFVGHGIGGAYATLAALYFRNLIVNGTLESNGNISTNKINIITFGAPRIGNLAFVKQVKQSIHLKNLFRITHLNDWLSRDFMSKRMFLHNEVEYWLDYEKDDCECPSKKQILFQCFGRNSRQEIDENEECNLGTVDSEEGHNIMDPNIGPYFGLDFDKELNKTLFKVSRLRPFEEEENKNLMRLGKEKKLYGKRTQNPSGPIKKEFKTEKIKFFDKTAIFFMRRMAEIANFAYCSTSNRIGRVVGDNEVIADVSIDKKNGVKFVVYFRGANLSKEQWRQRSILTSEVQLDPFREEKSIVDAIWLKHTKMMMPLLIKRFKRLHNPDNVSFVGHGIGGAYATLAALYFRNLIVNGTLESNRNIKINKINIITFGAPRIGNLAFVKQVKQSIHLKNLFRITHLNDWLSRDFMSKRMFLHHEVEYWLDNSKDDCGCLSEKQILFQCFGRNSRQEIDENEECNLGTVDSEEGNNIMDPNIGPYFGISFGTCNSNRITFSEDESYFY